MLEEALTLADEFGGAAVTVTRVLSFAAVYVVFASVFDDEKDGHKKSQD